MKKIAGLVAIILVLSAIPHSLVAKQNVIVEKCQEEIHLEDVWVYTKGKLGGRLEIWYLTSWLCAIFKLGVFKEIYVEYSGDGKLMIWNESGLVYEYTGKYTFDAKIFKGYYNPRIFHHPFRRGHCIGFGFCKELIIKLP